MSVSSATATVATARDITTATAPELDHRGKKLIADLAPRDRSPAIRAALAALRRWHRRQARKEHPAGRCDRAGRWYPSDAEDRDGFTGRVREPSRAWPWSFMQAARSLPHCEALERADHRVVLALRRGGFVGDEDAAGIAWE